MTTAAIPLLFTVGNDVRRLDELTLAQRADRAAMPVRAHHVELEALLVEPVSRCARRVGADVPSGDQATRLHVLHRQAGFEYDDACPWSSAVTNRSDDEVLARREGAEVDERGLCSNAARCARLSA